MSDQVATVVRTGDEVQRAHDILVAILVEDVPCPPDANMEQLNIAASVLCWMLGHDHNAAFETTIAELDRVVTDMGYVLTPRAGG